jgi:LysR family cyn operon transcriptional activator
VILESAAPHTLIALTSVGYGIAVVPSTVAVPACVRALPLMQRAASTGRWLTIAWDPQRLLAAFAKQFMDELVAFCRVIIQGEASSAMRHRCPSRSSEPMLVAALRR